MTPETIATCASSVVAALAAVGAIVVALYVNYDSKRPSVAVFLDYDEDTSSLWLVVKNFGNGIARDISFVEFDYSIVAPKWLPKFKESFVANGIPMLVPGAQRKTVIAVGGELHEMESAQSSARLTYKEPGMLGRPKTTSDVFILDYISYAGSLSIKSDLHEIRDSLKKMEGALKTISQHVG